MEPTEFEDAKQLWKMFYARTCFEHARNAGEYLLEKNLGPRDKLFAPLMAGTYVMYAKPFTNCHGVGRLTSDIIPPEQRELHETILMERHKFYAHIDAKGPTIPDFGEANHVRVFRYGGGHMQLGATLFHARPPTLRRIVNLCQKLQEKTTYHINKLFEKHMWRVPAEDGEFLINISDAAGEMFLPVQPILSSGGVSPD